MQTPFETYLRRRNLKGRSSMLAIVGFILCQSVLGSDHAVFTGGLRWLFLAVGLGAIVFGVWLYLPISRAEKREGAAWKRRERAELEAADAFLLGSSQKEA